MKRKTASKRKVKTTGNLFTGVVKLRMTPRLHELLYQAADQNFRSLTSEIEFRLVNSIGDAERRVLSQTPLPGQRLRLKG